MRKSGVAATAALAAAALGATLCAPLAGGADPAGPGARITAATFEEPVARYGHNVLGDTPEWAALRLQVEGGPEGAHSRLLRLPQDRVFEDIAPRLADVDGDGRPEVLVVESQQQQGARLSIYGTEGLIAATPHIGTRNRWLAPLGVADLDGDGRAEIAYVDRPHLARLVKVWRLEDGALRLVAEAPGLTNHQIGWPEITGGIARCATPPRLIGASPDWTRLVTMELQGGRLISKDAGPWSRQAEAALLECRSAGSGG